MSLLFPAKRANSSNRTRRELFFQTSSWLKPSPLNFLFLGNSRPQATPSNPSDSYTTHQHLKRRYTSAKWTPFNNSHTPMSMTRSTLPTVLILLLI